MRKYQGLRFSLHKTSFFFLFLLCGFLCVGSVAAQSYEVVVYQPTNSFDDTSGLGIGGLQRAGSGRIAGFVSPENSHALLWTGDSVQPVDLHPTMSGVPWLGNRPWTYSAANDTDGTTQVGYVSYTDYPNTTFTGDRYAALWNGTSQSFVRLCSFGSNAVCGSSIAAAVSGNQQVGYLISSTFPGQGFGDAPDSGTFFYAALWRGSEASFVLLHPRNINGSLWSDSRALDTDGVRQVGWGIDQSFGTEFRYRALLWNGTRDSVADLTPPGNIYNYVEAHGIRNDAQVGWGYTYSPNSSCSDALVWRGTAASYRVLSPCAEAVSTNGTTHVGSKTVDYYSHAFRWDGDTGAGVDLHALLPARVYRNSSAERIDDAGNIIGTAQRADNYRTVAVLWRVASAPNIAPTVSLTEIRNNGQYRAGSPMNLRVIAADADGSVARVEYFINDVSIGVIEAGQDENFTRVWRPIRAGNYTIRARATDNAGATTMSGTVSIRVGDGMKLNGF